jgi:hypothetical protein
VPVGLDEAWQNYHICRINYLGTRGAHLPAHCNDLPVAYMDDSASNVTERIVHGHHMAVANDELAARRQDGRHRLRLPKTWRRQ